MSVQLLKNTIFAAMLLGFSLPSLSNDQCQEHCAQTPEGFKCDCLNSSWGKCRQDQCRSDAAYITTTNPMIVDTIKKVGKLKVEPKEEVVEDELLK